MERLANKNETITSYWRIDSIKLNNSRMVTQSHAAAVWCYQPPVTQAAVTLPVTQKSIKQHRQLLVQTRFTGKCCYLGNSEGEIGVYSIIKARLNSQGAQKGRGKWNKCCQLLHVCLALFKILLLIFTKTLLLLKSHLGIGVPDWSKSGQWMSR